MKDCKHCTNAGRNCIPCMLLMDKNEIHHWCKARKEALHITYDEIAQETNLPKRTVERIFADDQKDCLYENMRPIIRILSGCTDEELDCERMTEPDALLEQRARQMEDTITRMEEGRKNQQEQYKRNVEFLKSELAHERIRYKSMKISFTVAVIAAFVELIIIIVALIIDMANSGVGFFWLNKLLGSIGGIFL